MKAFSRYPKGQTDLYILLDTIKKYGRINCNFETFCRLHYEWHTQTFPGCKYTTSGTTFRPDWFQSFLDYISDADIKEEEVGVRNEPVSKNNFFRRLFYRGGL
jgi:hypothetical protein